nr:RNA-dependent RNA polymerase [Flumine narna-like virus 34]
MTGERDFIVGDLHFSLNDAMFTKFAKQTDSQLMGSVVSFPFLCMANYTLSKQALEMDHNKIYTPSNIPMAINGDDIVTRGSKHLFRYWKGITAIAGLKSSVGKTYVSKEFLVMNSTFYDFKRTFGVGSGSFLTERKYVNMGLVYGRAKDGSTKEKRPTTLSSLSHELFRTCPSELYESAHKLFIRCHKETLKLPLRVYKPDKILLGRTIKDRFGKPKLDEDGKQVYGAIDVPYYIPTWLGGHGLRRPPGEKLADREKFDLKIAGLFAELMDDPLPGDNNHLKISRLVDCTMWQVAKKIIPVEFLWLGNQPFKNIVVEGTERVLAEENDRWFNEEVINCLFKFSIEELIDWDFCEWSDTNQDEYNLKTRIPHKIANMALQRNSRAWKLMRERVTDGTVKPFRVPRTYEELEWEKKDFFLPLFDVRLATYPSIAT